MHIMKFLSPNQSTQGTHCKMTSDPIDLDERRSREAQDATELRRQHLYEFQTEQAALQLRQEALEKLLLADPAKTWLEVAASAQYLLELFAATHEAQEPRRKKLIARTMEDLQRLSGKGNRPS